MTVCAPAWLLGLVAVLLAGPQAVRAVSRRQAFKAWDRQVSGDDDHR